MKQPRITVAEYITQLLNLSPKSQREISDEVGWENPTTLTMIKSGRVKLPVHRVPAMAKALGVDPHHLLRLVMEEYTPETWGVLRQVIGSQLDVAEDELALIHLVREAGGGQIPDLSAEDNIEELRHAVEQCYKRDRARAKATAEAIAKIPLVYRGSAQRRTR